MYDVLCSFLDVVLLHSSCFTFFFRWKIYELFEVNFFFPWHSIPCRVIDFVYTRLKYTKYIVYILNSIRFFLWMRRCFNFDENFQCIDVINRLKKYIRRFRTFFFLLFEEEAERKSTPYIIVVKREKRKRTRKQTNKQISRQAKCWKAYRERETHESDMFLYVFMNNVVIKPQQCVFLLWLFHGCSINNNTHF